MIINHTSGGRMGNQLMQLLHLAASAREYGWRIWDIAFHVKREFTLRRSPNLRVDNIEWLVWLLFRIPVIPGLVCLFKYLGVHFVNVFCCRPGKMPTELGAPNKSRSFFIMNCWPYTDYRSLYLHQNELRQFIAPKDEYTKEAGEWIQQIRMPDAVLVGVHIRRTDYRCFCDGKHYFELDFYKKKMLEIQRFSTRKVQFVICSDERVDEAYFLDEIEHLYISRHSFMADFVILSMCDYIIGPPSTFASTASFLGNAKRFTLYTVDDKIESFDSFGVSMIDFDDVHIWKENQRYYRFHLKLSEGSVVSCSPICDYDAISGAKK